MNIKKIKLFPYEMNTNQSLWVRYCNKGWSNIPNRVWSIVMSTHNIIMLIWRTEENWPLIIIKYLNFPKFSDRQVWANNADPDQTAPSQIRVYTVCHSVCIVWTRYSMVDPHSSNFRVITTNILGVQILENLRYPINLFLWQTLKQVNFLNIWTSKRLVVITLKVEQDSVSLE